MYNIYFFYINPPTPDTHTLSLHDALPIFNEIGNAQRMAGPIRMRMCRGRQMPASIADQNRQIVFPGRLEPDRKSTRLNSSHRTTSYAVFCLKKTNHATHHHPQPPTHSMNL